MCGTFDRVHENNNQVVVEDHIAEARRLLKEAPEMFPESQSAYLAAAQVHASIATAKATLYAAVEISSPRR